MNTRTPIPRYIDRYEFEERPGIYEFDAGMKREEAEAKAHRDLLKAYDMENNRTLFS